MKMFDTLATEERRATRLVSAMGRAYYINRGHSVTLQVYSNSEHEVSLLKEVFGGNYYRHRNGFQWVLSSKEGLAKVARYVSRPFPLAREKQLAPLFALVGDGLARAAA